MPPKPYLGGRNACLRRQHQRYKNKAFFMLGNKCANPACQWLNGDGSRGCTDKRCLQIDHIVPVSSNKLNKRRTTFICYREIIKGSKEYQLLCANCNWIKNRENNEGHYGIRVR